MKTKNSKKVLALILSFFMILTVLPFNVMASGGDATGSNQNTPASGAESGTPGSEQTKTSKEKLDDAKAAAIAKLSAKMAEVEPEINKIKDKDVKEEKRQELIKANNEAETAINKIPDTSTPEDAQKLINAEVTKFETKADEVKTAAQAIVDEETKAAAKELAEAKKTANTALEEKANARKAEIDKLDAKVYDIEKSKAKVEEALKEAKAEVEKAATKEKVTAAKDKDDKAVEGATVSVFGRTTKTDAYGNFSFNMTKESGNYYCGYYGYYWKDYPYNSSKVTTTTGYYKGYNNSSYGRYFFLVDAKGAVVNSVYAKAYENYYLSGDAYTNYAVYSSEYGYNYGYNYGYPYYDKYYNRYYNPKTDWAYGKTVTATKDGYEAGYKDLYNVTNNSWLYTTCYEYGYPYGYDRVIYPSALSLSGNGTIVSGKVGVSYLPIYVYRNGVFLGSGNADVNGYFSIGLNSRVSSTSDLTFYAYGKTEATPQKKADHGVIPVKSTVVIGSTKLIKNINGVEADVNMDVAPFIRDGRTMLPLRYIAEALGFKVDWDRATRTVTLTDKEFKVQIPVETNKIIVNGSTYYSDANPVLRNGRTMLPVANIARALGLKDGTDILWDANTRVATITRLVKY